MLLLDDDPAFREIIKDFLSENGYAVIAVQNGTDGIKEVLAGDFSLILCDIRMPKLSGPVFFRAVERIRPHLCGRFVFMSGYRGDSETNEFIESVSGFLLRKPFPLSDLLDWIAVTEVCSAHRSIFDGAAADAARLPAGEKADVTLGRAAPQPTDSELEKKVAAIISRSQAAPVPAAPPAVFHSSEPERRPAGGSGVFVYSTIALILAVCAGLGNRYWDARDRVEVVSLKRAEAEAAWTAVALKLQDARATEVELEKTEQQLALISADRAKARWTLALRSIIPSADAKITILQIDARGSAKDTGACELRIHGTAGGSPPRLTADRFRQSVEEGIKRTTSGRAVASSFEQLEDTPGQGPEKKQATFLVLATLGPASKEAR